MNDATDKMNKKTENKNNYYRSIQEVINLSVHPICIRGNNGIFLICNRSFSESFLDDLKLTEWLSNLDFETSHKLCDLEIEVYSLEVGIIIEENIIINGHTWDFIITKLTIENMVITVWEFSRIYRKIGSGKKFRPQIMEAINILKTTISNLNESQRNNLALYCLGASHNLISKILNISVGTSKNRIRDIQNKLPINNKEDIFIIIHISGISFILLKYIAQLITNNVNRLLKKQ
ncbi:hypothetical protein VSX61_10635 [Brenneria populi subsp. brevivirga]|uniref:hypothetical protein n=1 Tax=Brenneria populi TaxID=1505588 RepID=UPI002E16F9D2|nr:hypothetical protein [Brenneria populi subsp. brevivirga]